MRFTAATVAFFAGLAAAMPNAADTTVYETQEVTITSCGPEVTNCPASSGVVPTSAPAVTTVPSGAGAGSSPAPSGPAPSGPASSGPAPSGAPSWTSSVPAVAPTTAPGSGPAPAPSASSWTVIAHTTCVPTVVYSTVPVPAATSAGGNGPAPHAPSSSKPAGASGTPAGTPSASATPVYNGAGALSGSMGLAGVAAMAAFVLA